MNIFRKLGEFFMGMFKKDARNEFNTNIISSEIMEMAQSTWNNIIQGNPPWKSENVRTINFAKTICQFVGKKACLDLKVAINGSDRADYIDKCVQKMVKKSIRDKLEDACGLGGIILKPSGTFNPDSAIDFVMPGHFIVTEKNANGDILGIIFVDQIQKGDDYYTRLEYQHFVYQMENDENEKLYAIINKAYKSKKASILGKQILLTDVDEWKNIQPVQIVNNVDKPLFAYLKMPYNNTIDYSSPEGVSVFSNCLEELKDLDIAWSRKSDEVDDSQHITFIDENALVKVNKDTGAKERIKLPRFVKGLRHGVDAGSTIDEHVPVMLSEQRIADINSILSMISTKMGFSQGQFVLDEKTGRITATQVESDDSETVETINDIRSALKTAITDLIYALNKYCDFAFEMPDGYVNALDEDVPEEDIYYFKDLMASFEQDRSRAYQLMMQGVYSKKKYLMEYEGFSEEEALEMLEEAKEERKPVESGLFPE